MGSYKEIGNLIEMDRDDDTLVEFIDTKIQINLEINKDETFWE